MRYKIKEIGEGGIDVCVTINQAWLTTECPEATILVSEKGLQMEGRLEPAGNGYLLRGTLRGEFSVACARCLEPANVPIDAPIAVSFVEREAGDQEDDELQDDVIPFEHGIVDIGPSIREEILLGVPMSPVCRPDCAGICPKCGCNRNLTPCDCVKQPSETSKFSRLAKMKLQ
jgi:uncharacterized protein